MRNTNALTFTASIFLLVIDLLGCQSTPEPPGPSAWRQLFTAAQPLSKQQVYAIAGKPVRETESAAYWESQPVKKLTATYLRELKVDFDANGYAVRMYDGEVRELRK
jgi:hypothetical protein